MGGMTACLFATTDKRPKACLVLDPWLFAYHKEIEKGDFKILCPLISISSWAFHPSIKKFFNSWDCVVKMFECCENKVKKNLEVAKTGHFHQCDLAAVIPFDMFVIFMFRPQFDIVKRYELFTNLWMEFLEQLNLMPTELGKSAKQNIQRFKKEIT